MIHELMGELVRRNDRGLATAGVSDSNRIFSLIPVHAKKVHEGNRAITPLILTVRRIEASGWLYSFHEEAPGFQSTGDRKTPQWV